MSEPPAAAATGSDPASRFEMRDQRLVAAPLVRRMAAFMYEGVLLFGIVFATGLVFAVTTHQTSGMKLRGAFLAVLFFVVGLYFIGLWIRSGQTLAMKTWHLRLLTDRGLPLAPRRALARYVAAYVWFLPALAIAKALMPIGGYAIAGILCGWIALYALGALLHPRRQFWHDALCDTAIVFERPAPPRVS
jgi:uncharacterized RDD family membrane protein YckC